MSDSFLPHRLRFTPIRDVLRGRLTGRLDWRGRIDASDLPDAAKTLIRDVVRRTGLWRSEQTAVADELIAHFTDGLTAGTSADDLVKAFGDGAVAARLIRRAKRRNRPLAWQAMRVLGWGLAVLIGVYAVLAARFYAGRPSPTVDYVAWINRDIEAVPPEDRAWPIYREVLLTLGERDKPEPSWHGDGPYESGDPAWQERAEWLRANAGVLERLREAAAKPALGFPLSGGSEFRRREPDLWPSAPSDDGTADDSADADSPMDAADALARNSLINLTLPHLSDLRPWPTC